MDTIAHLYLMYEFQNAIWIPECSMPYGLLVDWSKPGWQTSSSWCKIEHFKVFFVLTFWRNCNRILFFYKWRTLNYPKEKWGTIFQEDSVVFSIHLSKLVLDCLWSGVSDFSFDFAVFHPEPESKLGSKHLVTVYRWLTCIFPARHHTLWWGTSSLLTRRSHC